MGDAPSDAHDPYGAGRARPLEFRCNATRRHPWFAV